VDLSALAAFTAAGLSLINVGVSARLSSSGRKDEWRRNEERPVVAQILTLSQDTLGKWNEAALARQMWIDASRSTDGSIEIDSLRTREREHYTAAMNLWAKLRYQIAELDLIAGRPVRDAANAIYAEHGVLATRLRPPGPQDNPLSVVGSSKVNRLQEDLIAKTRADLGLDSPRANRMTSLRQRLKLLRSAPRA
jgi:hypothetical protein